MTRERPLLVLLAAIANILLGGFCVLAGCGGAGRWFFAVTRRSNLSDLARAQVEGGLLIELVNSLELLAAGSCLVVASVGLLWMQPWARWLALAYALLMLGWQMLYAALQVLWVWPGVQEFFLERASMRQSYSPDEIWTFQLMFFGGLLLQAGVLGGHALALMVLLGWPSVAAAFSTPVPANQP